MILSLRTAATMAVPAPVMSALPPRCSGTALHANSVGADLPAKSNTHFSAQGGAEMAGLVVQGVRELNLPLVSYLR